jgi:ABC-type transport system involved in multi-copper enzyme maturation permease subunit
MVRQTLAILHDAYRELNARKMFWIALLLSGLAMGAFAIIGVTPHGLAFGTWEWETPYIPPASQYKFLFNTLMVDWWLTWAVLILALVSTAGIFPDFLSGGSVDLFISKPISRLRLFLTKYFAGMLYAFLQVTIFAIVAFIVFGTRGHMWEPRLFLAVPIVLCLFSYLYAISVLLGVLTRSTVATLLLTVLIWGIIGGMHFGEIRLAALKNIYTRRIETIDKDISNLDKAPTTATTNAQSRSALKSMAGVLGVHLTSALSPERDRLMRRREEATKGLGFFTVVHRIAYPLHLVLPKTSETSDLLNRSILSTDEFLELLEGRRDEMAQRFRRQVREQDMFYVNDEIAIIRQGRSAGMTLASSLAFEVVIVGLAAWIFCRRDF